MTLKSAGAEAKLEPEEGKTIFDGLCIRVALGKVWKENLSELSGGQRSLLALSLVLAQLLVNPAPVYILGTSSNLFSLLTSDKMKLIQLWTCPTRKT